MENINVSIPLAVLESLAVEDVDYSHDENGPGRIYCCQCYANVKMRWENGEQLEDGSKIEHHPYCPHIWAKNTVNNL